MSILARRPKWLGIDMRPRWSRQAAVLLTYAVFFAGLGFPHGGWGGYPLVATGVLIAVATLFGVFGRYGPLKWWPLDEPKVEAQQWAYRWSAFFAASAAGRYLMIHRPISGIEVAANMWRILVVMETAGPAR
jgi:hypothetical protein